MIVELSALQWVRALYVGHLTSERLHERLILLHGRPRGAARGVRYARQRPRGISRLTRLSQHHAPTGMLCQGTILDADTSLASRYMWVVGLLPRSLRSADLVKLVPMQYLAQPLSALTPNDFSRRSVTRSEIQVRAVVLRTSAPPASHIGQTFSASGRPRSAAWSGST